MRGLVLGLGMKRKRKRKRKESMPEAFPGGDDDQEEEQEEDESERVDEVDGDERGTRGCMRRRRRRRIRRDRDWECRRGRRRECFTSKDLLGFEWAMAMAWDGEEDVGDSGWRMKSGFRSRGRWRWRCWCRIVVDASIGRCMCTCNCNQLRSDRMGWKSVVSSSNGDIRYPHRIFYFVSFLVSLRYFLDLACVHV
jgi:hypothetical protein